MAGVPGRNPAATSHNDLLLDFDDSQPVYSSGRPPPAQDHDLLDQFDIDDADEDPSRPSVSYDEFVGGRSAEPRGVAGLSSGERDGAPGALRPGAAPTNNRAYSQTSVLHNYRDEEDDELAEDDFEYYGTGGLDDNTPTNAARQSQARSRNSIMSMGGGFMGRAKNMLGIPRLPRS